ncbi:MAG TPA: histidine kinase dimerization/phosphoacceptor domain -containing protein [Reyranella sp.]|nr:histidine kinase dimerization/phosphoacceptor domain -containing protein [Reyranella sp.]
MAPSEPKRPVVEEAPEGRNGADAGDRAVQVRIRQQEILAELGVVALRGPPLMELLNEAVRLAADGLEADLCKILEYIPSENRLLMRAGVGWDPGLIGVASVGADLASPSGYALRTGKPVISNQLENEQRFRTPDLLRAHGVRRAINVILQGDGAPYGVLEVDSRSEGDFSEHDIAFLQGAANIIGMAIERQRYETRLKAALEHQQVLVKEINHRVKNSLQLVASMLNLRATTQDEPAVTQVLAEASGRVSAIARAHERLYKSSDIGSIELAAYLEDVCADLSEVTGSCTVAFESSEPIFMATDQAIRLALLISELVTNSAKHAYPNGADGRVSVRLSRRDADTASISVRDEGRGLPSGFDIAKSSGLGMRIVTALSEASGATVTARNLEQGAEFVIDIPLQPTVTA